jgi:predicted permease
MMSFMRKALQRVRSCFPDSHQDRELDAEMAVHLDLAIEDNLKKGMSAAEARRQAFIQFGGVEQARQQQREARGGFALGTLSQDLRFALRMWWKNPGFVAAAVITIGLGIGINTAGFTVARAVLFKSMGFANDPRIVYIFGTRPDCDLPCEEGRSYPDYVDFRRQAKTLESLVAYRIRFVSVSDKSDFPNRYEAMQITANGLGVLGHRPLLGRSFIPADEQPGAAPVAILAHGLWERRYGKDPAIIGKEIRLNEVPTMVIGVMPADLQMQPVDVDMWLPLAWAGESQKRENRELMMFGRLAPGADAMSANAEMESISRQLESAYPASNKDLGIRVLDAMHYFGFRIRLMFLALWIAVGFVLLVACANVANLLLARAMARKREISIRIALGAGRWRVIRQLLLESVTLSAAGGFAGWLLAIWIVRIFDAAVPDKPAWVDFRMNYAVLGYLAVISVGAGILFGLAPALRLSKVGVQAALKDGGPGASGGSRKNYLASSLVVAEMALTVVLLVGAGLMIRLIVISYRSETGVNSANVLTMHVDLPDKKYSDPNRQIAFYEQLETGLRGLPGVEAASIASSLPGHDPNRFPYELEGAAPLDPQQTPQIGELGIGAEYFRVMDVRPLLGRVFTDADGAAAGAVVIVNRACANKFWPGERNPLGKRLRLVVNGKPKSWLTVIGVVPDIFQSDTMRNRFDPLIYLPYREEPEMSMSVAARTTVPPTTLVNAFRHEVQRVDEDLPVFALHTLEEDLDLNNWPIRVFGAAFTGFAVMTLLMASIGLYAVVAHGVSQRTQEIGVRLAMGASRANILGLVFVQGMRQIGLGLLLGLTAAFGLSRLLRAVLSKELQPDSAMFVVVALVLIAAAALACGIPANRATRVDPVEALRCE